MTLHLHVCLPPQPPPPPTSTGSRDLALEFESDVLGGRMYFMQFETRRFDSFVAMMKAAKHLHVDASTIVCATGGGARK